MNTLEKIVPLLDLCKLIPAGEYAAAPEMYEFIEWLRTVEGQCVILKGEK